MEIYFNIKVVFYLEKGIKYQISLYGHMQISLYMQMYCYRQYFIKTLQMGCQFCLIGWLLETKSQNPFYSGISRINNLIIKILSFW